MIQRISFETNDGVVIVGNWYPVEAAARGALLLHMMPATKESWEKLAQELNKRGIAALAIDLRGHGESIKKQIVDSGSEDSGTNDLNFQRFSDAKHQESIRDIQAAVEWLAAQELEKGQIFLTGASIGANLALQYASDTPEIKKIVLLSPGLDYRGVKTEPAISLLTPDSLLRVVVARGDDYAATSSKKLKDRRPTTMLTLLDGSAHGTDLFDDHPEVLTEIADFLSK